MKKRILAMLLAAVMLIGIFPTQAFAAARDEAKDQVRVIIENTTYSVDYGAPWDGTLVDTWVDIDETSTMMGAVGTALEEYGYEGIGLDSGYISGINGLSEFDGGSGAGWMGTLNDWFTNTGFADVTVAEGELMDGDVVRIMYTCDMGIDLGGDYTESLSDSSLSALTVSIGTMEPAFDASVTDYTVTVPAGTSQLDVSATANNKRNQVTVSAGGTTYRRGEGVAVVSGTAIEIVVGLPSEGNTPTTYTLTVAVEGEEHTHSFGDWTVTKAATCTEAGEQTRSCECGETETETIDALGHSYENGTCTVCGEADPDYVAPVPFSQAVTVPSNGDSSWGSVTKLTLSGDNGSVYEAYWSSASEPFVLDVILGQETPKDATITAEFTVGGLRAPSVSGDTTVTLEDGKGTIQVTVVSGISAFYSDTHWTINITVDDGSAANRPTYEVTLPTDTVGYTVTAYNSESPVIEGRNFSFKVTIDSSYTTEDTFAVKTNDTVLTAVNGVYTIENIMEDQTVTVEGIREKTLAEQNVTIIVPAGSTVSSGKFYSYFKYDFNEPLETTTLADGRLQFIFPVPGSQGFLRVQHPQGVTYWDFDGLTAGSVFEITGEMLFIGSEEFTKETVYANFEQNIKDKADLYLTANEKGWLDLNTGDIWNLNVFRNFLSLGNSITNNCVALPDVEYKIISVDGTPSDGVITVTPDANNSSYAEIKAVGSGTAIILVSYDAVYNNDGEGGKQWSAIWPENTGVIIVTVDAEDASITTNMTVNEEANSTGKQVIDAEHDILFYVGDSGASYSFKPEEGCTVSVNRSTVGATMTFGGFTASGVETAEDGTVTVSGLTTGTHIIKVEKDGKAVYQVLRARQVSYELTHEDGTVVDAENPAKPGETITVQFHDLISPMEKLSGVYNANFGFYYNGPYDAQIRTSGGTYGVYSFSGSETLQKFTVTIPEYWNDTTYTLTDGAIKIGGYGSNAGAHRTTTYVEGKEVNTNASGVAGVLSVLPDVVITTTPCGYNSYNVTMPAGEGYTVSGGDVPVAEGESYTFTVTVVGGYDGSGMTVKVNGVAITGTDGSYTVENVTEDLIVTVEGVEKITVEMDPSTAVYTNGVDGTEWGRGTRAYVDTVSVSGVTVESYSWEGNTCNIVLPAGTAKSAAVGFVITFAGSPESWVAKMAATLNGTAMTAGEAVGVMLVDGQATVEIYASYNNSSNYGGTKTFVLTVAECVHTAGEAVTENEVVATCTSDGSYDTVVYCTVCEEEMSRETTTVPATGHTAGEAVTENEVAATCTSDGSYDTVVYCTVCEEELSRETTTIPATGHTAGEAVTENEVAATCTTDGSYDTVVYCTVCEEEISRETTTVPASGHNYENGTCTGCGAADPGFVDVEHIYKTTGDYLDALEEEYGISVGAIGGEWMVIGLVRSGREVDDTYCETAVKYILENINEDERLHRAKSTENSRLILALTAMGYDVTDVDGHNLLEGLDEMSYLKKQGINGPIWALIALDSHDYEPVGDVTREALIDTILAAQLEDGGWALSGTAADADMTGMALTALAPYYSTNEKVKEAVDKALDTLSAMQYADGSFGSVDGSSAESCAQVIVALTALGINPETDARFIKDGISVIDALCAFYVEGGGFRHIADGNLDGMATEQGYYALAAYYRFLNGQTALYDMRDVTIHTGSSENPGEDPDDPEVPGTAADGSVTVYVTIAVEGAPVMAMEQVTVTDVNCNGYFDVDDALYAAHELDYTGGAAAGYASYDSAYGLSLAKLWGNDSGFFGYWLNDSSCWSLGDAVADGDYVVAFVYQDTAYWSDAYTTFEKDTYSAEEGTALTVKLNKAGYDESWNTVFSAYAGATITVYDTEGNAVEVTVTDNGDGTYTVTLPAGTYTMVATGTEDTIVPAVCAVTVTAKAENPADPTDPSEGETTDPTTPGGSTDSPETGDESGIALYGILMILSMAALAVVLIADKKHKFVK